jgi:cytochrome c oxidase subunit 2
MTHSIGPGYATAWQLGFQDAASPIMKGITILHNDVLVYMVAIIIFVVSILGRTLFLYSVQNTKTIRLVEYASLNYTLLEVVWTLAPSLILVVIAIPSFSLLYAMNEVVDPALTIKAIGHQWYWSYEYTDYESPVTFDSFLVQEDDLTTGQLRLLEVDRKLVIPINTHIRILTTSTDVLHSWAVPALGVKMDACPGRLNETSIFATQLGIFYGQCSEICGVNHGFMPINVQVVPVHSYVSFITESK